ncbi:hypothetical protein CLIM01_00005 [Colletotrichum limetticola]|uniref:Uncharacterized protein n=1 Tax=Colletotrichum limetticola TaxID=1209924 RepID=A0ABQ9QFP5_9PEZI|nr:hypothetical protein CLIM01_00005 [Colletotrichum limetticola]
MRIKPASPAPASTTTSPSSPPRIVYPNR